MDKININYFTFLKLFFNFFLLRTLSIVQCIRLLCPRESSEHCVKDTLLEKFWQISLYVIDDASKLT